jgi:mRNA interferase RelE/StbE
MRFPVSLNWEVKLTPKATKQLSKLDKNSQRRIFSFLKKRLALRDDPRELGKKLTGTLADLWRYRVGDHRLVCELRDEQLLVLIVRVGHRKEIY